MEPEFPSRRFPITVATWGGTPVLKTPALEISCRGIFTEASLDVDTLTFTRISARKKPCEGCADALSCVSYAVLRIRIAVV